MAKKRPNSITAQFLRKLAFGVVAVALVITQLIKAQSNNTGQTISFPQPLQTSSIHQPDADIRYLAISPVSGRMAVSAYVISAGSEKKYDNLLYINSSEQPDKFEVKWSPNVDFTDIYCIGWSHDEKTIAFMATTGNLTTKNAECWIYTLDVKSGTTRKILKIGESVQGKDKNILNVPERTGLAWLGENKICLLTKDDSIISVDCNDGHIETIVPEQNGSIRGTVSVSPNKLRFAKRRLLSDRSGEVEICEFNGSEVISLGIIPSVNYAELNFDGKYAFCTSKTEQLTDIIFDISNRAVIKQIPRLAEDETYRYRYKPIAVLKGGQLLLFTSVSELGKATPYDKIRLVSIKL